MAASRHEVRVVALGNRDRGDDGAALQVAERMAPEVRVFLAGRAGTDLMDLLVPEERCLLLDVTVSGAEPGHIREIPLDQLSPEVLPDLRVSSHGFGPGEALALARALGRSIPVGVFLGVEGKRFGIGEGLSAPVRKALPHLEEKIQTVLRALAEPGR